jgi:hypothetical protein
MKPLLCSWMVGEERFESLSQDPVDAQAHEYGCAETERAGKHWLVAEEAMDDEAHLFVDDFIGDPFTADWTEHVSTSVASVAIKSHTEIVAA